MQDFLFVTKIYFCGGVWCDWVARRGGLALPGFEEIQHVRSEMSGTSIGHPSPRILSSRFGYRSAAGVIFCGLTKRLPAQFALLE